MHKNKLIEEQLKYFYKHLNHFEPTSREYKVIFNGISEIENTLSVLSKS